MISFLIYFTQSLFTVDNTLIFYSGVMFQKFYEGQIRLDNTFYCVFFLPSTVASVQQQSKDWKVTLFILFEKYSLHFRLMFEFSFICTKFRGGE